MNGQTMGSFGEEKYPVQITDLNQPGGAVPSHLSRRKRVSTIRS